MTRPNFPVHLKLLGDDSHFPVVIPQTDLRNEHSRRTGRPWRRTRGRRKRWWQCQWYISASDVKNSKWSANTETRAWSDAGKVRVPKAGPVGANRVIRHTCSCATANSNIDSGINTGISCQDGTALVSCV